MLNRLANAAKTWVVVGVGALVLGLAAFFILSNFSPDSTFAHDPDVHGQDHQTNLHGTGENDVNHIHFDENDTDPVQTFMSTDPETGEAVDWDVTGVDGDAFQIDASGVLTFKNAPDYESPTDKLRAATDLNGDEDTTDPGEEATVADDNTYHVTVRATEQQTPGDPMGRALASETFLRVIVDNKDEDGTVELNLLQPEVGTALTAMLTDPDEIEGTITWEWSVSKVTNPNMNTEAHWTVITGDTDNMFTPRGVRAAAIDPRPNPDPANPIDEGEFVRAKASYADDQSAQDDDPKVAIGVSKYPVRAEVDSILDPGIQDATNDSPGFRQGLDYTRSVPETTGVDMNVGAPVVALDPNSDIRSYSLLAIGQAGDANFTDVDFFNIDRASGQITLAKMLDYEEMDERFDGTNDPTAGQYRVTVRATDPSGETGDVTVTITATAANDAPVIRGNEELRVMEQDSDDRNGDDTPDKTYTGGPNMLVNQAADEDSNAATDNSNVYRASDDDARGDITWRFKESSSDPEAADWALFVDSSTDLSGMDEPRALRFRTPPDFENPQDANRDNVYKVTLIADDRSSGGTDEIRISVFVMNEHEQGEAMLTASGDDPTQPVIGEAITAMVSDSDGGIAIVTWQWQRAGEKTGPWTPIPGATYATYTPQANIPGAEEDDDTTPDIDETEPTIVDQGMFLRAVATYIDSTSDPDDPDTNNIDERVQSAANTAKVATMGDGDGETSADEAADTAVTVYRVMATTEKAVRAPDTGDTTTTPPMDPVAPTFDPGSYTGMVYENSEVGSLVMMSDMVSAGMDQALMLDPADSEDNKYFTIDEHGQIRVGEVEFDAQNLDIGVQDVDSDDTAPAMADPDLDHEARSTYRLIVSAENEGGKSTANVTISLMDRNEHPYFDKQTREIDMDTTTADDFDRTVSYSEGSTSRNVQLLAAVEPDGDTLLWEVIGTDSADFEIIDAPDGADGKDRRQLRWKAGSQPDFERPMDRLLDVDLDGTVDDADGDDAAGNNMYKITVRVTEATTVGNAQRRAVELDLTVSVTNAEEDGVAQIRWRQLEVGTEISASVTDPDVVADANVDGNVTTGLAYIWYRAKVTNPDRNIEPADVPDTGSAQWEPITGATDVTYTPVGKPANDPLTPVDESDVQVTVDDAGWHLLVKTSYSSAVPGTTDNVEAIGISDYPVRANVHDGDNNSPGFQQGDARRTVAEDTPVGDPVGAAVAVVLNEDPGDILTYELVRETTGDDGNTDVEPGDLPFFSVDRDTGQIKVKQALDFEVHDVDTTQAVEAAEYQIVIRATDPSGEPGDENRDDITVVIAVTDVNEAPTVGEGKAIIQVREMNSSKESTDNGQYYIGLGNTADLTTSPYTVTESADDNTENFYMVSDEDPVDSHTWTLAGPDGALFEFSSTGEAISRRMHFIDPPDYENPKDQNRDNVYEVWVRATDNPTSGPKLSGHKAVRVEVMNVDEDGMLTLTPAEPIEATADDGVEITATWTDPDGEIVITDWMWVAADGRLTAFPTTDDEPDGVIDAVDQGHTTFKYTGSAGEFVWAKMSYRDGASVVDDPVTALDERNDDPGTDPTEQHKYQNLTDADPPILNTGDSLHHNSDEMLTKVTDTAVQAPEGEGPGTGPGDTTTDPTGPPSVIEIEREVPENTPSTGYVGMPLMADEMPGAMTGPDAPTFVFAEDVDGDDTYYDETLAPQPEPQDSMDKMGQLAIALTPDTEPMTNLDYEAIKNSYVVEFSDDNDPNSDIYRLTILVTDVNEAPSMPEEATGGLSITGPFNVSRYDEGRTDMVATYDTTGGDAGATVTWDLSGDDANDFRISSGGVLTFRSIPDYETPVDMNSDNIYSITVEAMDDTTPNPNVDTQFVAVTVGNVNEPGMLTVTSERPAVDRMITAMVEDGDGIIGTVTWTWSMADELDGTYEAISGADEAMYTVTEDDVDMFLQVKATYEDGHGRGKMLTMNFMYAVTMSLVFSSDMVEIMVDEDTAGGMEIGDPVVASGGQAETVMHVITGGADMAAFTIEAMTGQVSTAAAAMLDYETKDMYTFEVTATGTAAGGGTETVMTTVTVMVQNVDETGTVMLSPAVGRVDMEITATLDDPDGGVTGLVWQWESADAMAGPWTPISGATLPTYTPVAGDTDKYLRAVADYDDAEGSSKTAMLMTTSKVGEMPSTGNANADRYDTNPQDGMINGEEALDAVVDYFDENITSEELLDVLVAYFG